MTGDPLFPEVPPRCARRISVGDGHYLYVEEVGPLDGLPVVFLHGGPGSGCTPGQRRLFDPQRYRAIFIDQRGAGHSLPLGDLTDNTTADLIGDLELVREALGIQAWILFGGSWGSLLALAYAQIYPEHVLGLVLRGIFFGSREEITAYAQGENCASPSAWHLFANSFPAEERGDLLTACASRVLRSEERRVGKECRRLCRSRWSPYH
jgi:proline iminopeptidase